MFVSTTKNQIFKTITIAAVLLTAVLFAQNIHAAKKEPVSLGKIFIAWKLNQGFQNPEREDIALRLAREVTRDKELELVNKEDDADFRIVIISFSSSVKIDLYVRDGDNWKPGIQIENSCYHQGAYKGISYAVRNCKDDAKRWIKNRVKNR